MKQDVSLRVGYLLLKSCPTTAAIILDATVLSSRLVLTKNCTATAAIILDSSWEHCEVQDNCGSRAEVFLFSSRLAGSIVAKGIAAVVGHFF